MNMFLNTGNADFFINRKGKHHILSTSKIFGLTGFYTKFLLMSTTDIYKPILLEVVGTMICPPTI